MINVKVECNSGDSWVTGFKGTLQEAEEYFIGQTFTKHFDDEREFKITATKVVFLGERE